MAWSGFRRGGSWSIVIWSAVYLAVAIVVLFPVLATPVIADDLFNPFSQFDVVGGGPGPAIMFGWEGATEGASFRIVGNPFGALYNWLWLAIGARLGLSLTTLFAITKLVVLVLVAAAIAWSWRAATELSSSKPVPFRVALGWVSLMLFGTVQIHAGWSNDPVADYPLAGYVPTALGFATIGAAARLARSRRTAHAVGTALLAAVAVAYYELNVGAVIGATLLLAAVALSDIRRGRFDRAFLLKAVVVPLVPASLVVVGRLVTGDAAGTYGGTTVRLDGAAMTFVRSILTSVPGSSWRLSIDHLGGQLGVVFFVFGTVLLVVMAVRWWQTTDTGEVAVETMTGVDRDPVDLGPADSQSAESSSPLPRPPEASFFTVSFVLAVVIYAVAAVAVQAITVKVQDEAPGVGYVYTWYAMTSSTVALLLAMAARRIARRPATLTTVLVVAVASGFLFVQNTVNWRLSEQLNQSMAANRLLLDAYDDGVPVEQRCAALMQWASIPWPGYYEAGIVAGVQESFEYYFDEQFCPIPVGDD